MFSSAINIREIRVAQSVQRLGYGPDDLGSEYRYEQVMLPYSAMFTPDLSSTQPPMQWTEVKSEWSYTTTIPIWLYGVDSENLYFYVYLTKHRRNTMGRIYSM